MNLLFVSNLYPPIALGGYELACFDVAEALRREGHQVSILTSSFRAAEVGTPEPGVHRLLKLRWSPDRSRKGRSAGVGGNRLEVDWHNARTTRRLIEELTPEVVVVFNGANLGRTLFAAASHSAHVVYRVSDPWLLPLLTPAAGGWKRRLRRRVYDLVLRGLMLPVDPPASHRLIFCSNSLQSQYKRAGVDVSSSAVIYPGVPTELFCPRTQHVLNHATGDARTILYVGRICPAKGVKTLIQAVAQLRVMVSDDPVVTLVGPVEDQQYEEELQRVATRLGVNVRFLPLRPRAELPETYASHDVLVFPSEWEEPFGLVLVEAMAVGVPIVTTVNGGAREIVGAGRIATTFKAGDAQDLAQKLAWVLRHPEEAAAVAQAGSEHVRLRFNLRGYADALASYLQSVTAQSLSPAPAPTQPAHG